MVGAAGNKADVKYADDAVPASWFLDGQLPDFVVAAAASKHGLRAMHSVPWHDHTGNGMVYAPGLHLYQNGGDLLDGTSMGQSLTFAPYFLLGVPKTDSYTVICSCSYDLKCGRVSPRS